LKRYIPNKHQLYKVRGTWVNGVFPYFFEGALAIPSLRGPAHLTIFAIEVLVFINFWERSTDADPTDVDTEREGEDGSDGAEVTRSSFERVTLEQEIGWLWWMMCVCLFFRLHKRQASETAVLFQCFFSMFNLCFLLLPCVVGWFMCLHHFVALNDP